MPEDDVKLASAVKKYGNNWVAVAALVQGEANDQCRCRRLQCLDPPSASGQRINEQRTTDNGQLTTDNGKAAGGLTSAVQKRGTVP
jgi:hypothetical protein